MCFFHVKYNCKKNYTNYGLTNKDWKLIEVDIDFLSDCSFSKENSNIFHYLNKYRLWVTANLIYKGYNFIHCNCYSFYKSYICKLKLADIFGLKIKSCIKFRFLQSTRNVERNRTFLHLILLLLHHINFFN